MFNKTNNKSINESTNKSINELNIQTGYLFDESGKKFDISVILNFPTHNDFERSKTDRTYFPDTNLIDFYFGTPNDSDTNHFVNEFIKKQNKIQQTINTLQSLNNPELNDSINFLKTLLVELH